jgi:pimeloyl-ACP methyl ester carboxylesterase
MLIVPRPFGQVLNEAMVALFRVWKSLLIPTLVVSVPVGIASVSAFVTTGATEFLDVILNRPETMQTLPSEVFWELARPFYIAVAIATIAQLLAGVFIALASHSAVAAHLKGTSLRSGEVALRAISRYPAGLGATVLIAIGLTVLLGLGLVVWLTPLLAVGTPNPASILVALVLFAVLLGPGIWAGVAVSMTTSAVAIDKTGALGSIRRSIRLVRGRWWPTAGYLMLVGLLGGIAIQLIQLIALPLALVGGGTLTFTSMIGVLAQGLLVAAISAMYTHWYVDLRARKEQLSTESLG